MKIEQENFQIYQDIDLIALFEILWIEKWRIFLITSCAAVLSILYALSLPNIYKSEVLLTSVSASSGGAAGLSEFGGLASLAGVSLGSDGTDDITLGLVTLKSRVFLKDFIRRRDILVPLMALESWADGEIYIDENVYNLDQNSWVESVPKMQDAYKMLLSMLAVSKNTESGIIRVSISSQSPVLAKEWVTWLVKDLNDSMRNREIREANQAVLFLEEKVKSEVSVDMRAMLFRLLQKQTETIMLANVKADYLFRVVDPAIIPEDKIAPTRALICILGTLFGGFIAVVFVLSKHFLKSTKES